MVENSLRWFRHVGTKPLNYVVRMVDQMEDCHTTRGRRIPRKTIREDIKKELDINELDLNMIYDKILWGTLTHVTDST